MSNPFFLTRQTANLMEDFVRELNSNASLLMLYGESGVGKSRLLEELKLTHLSASKIHWIDLKAGGSGDGSLIDSSAMVEDVFAGAGSGDIVIADHLEMALQKTLHQLFLSCSTDGLEKQIKLIVCGNDKFFGEMRQLAERYHVRAKSFQLMALNSEEVEAFLGFYLFPERPIGKLMIPAMLQEQLVQAHGTVGKIIEIAERAGDQITTAPMDDVETTRKGSKNMVGILITLALVIGGGWYYLSSQSHTDDVPLTGNDTLAPRESSALVGHVVRGTPESLPEIKRSNADVVETHAEPGTASDEDAVLVAEVNSEQVEQGAVDEVTGQSAADAVETHAEPGTASDEDAVLVAEVDSQQLEQGAVGEVTGQLAATEIAVTAPDEAPMPPPATNRIDQELQASLDWMHRNDRKIGTIQIMLLAHDKFDIRVYQDYLDYLATRGVDISAIKIFKTYTSGRKFYSVVYGEYESWRAAGNAIQELPEVLRETSPIPRSVGGLMEEIQRLRAEN